MESPAKARTIKNFLGNEYKVVASKGHIRDLPKKKFGIKIEGQIFSPEYEVSADHKEIVSEIKKLAKDANAVYIATDEDREGEAIGYHINQIIDEKRAFPRIVFHEITKNAIVESLKNPRKINLDMVNAQQARRLLDRIVGFKLSPLLNQKIQKGLSAGRVQSSALKLIVDKEREIADFKPIKYFSIDAIFQKNAESRAESSLDSAPSTQKANSNIVDEFSGLCEASDADRTLSPSRKRAEALHEKSPQDEFADSAIEAILCEYNGKKIAKLDLQDESLAEQILREAQKCEFMVENIEEKSKKVAPPPPFMTSSLQQSASSNLGFSPTRTMQIAQKLYEGVPTNNGTQGVITYMRTDSLNIAKIAQDSARKVIARDFGEKYLPPKPRIYANKQKNAQEAHEAIRPTNLDFTPALAKDYLASDELKLYTLIYNQFLASQSSDALFANQNIIFGAQNIRFKASGSKLVFDGFHRILNTKNKDKILPALSQHERVKLAKCAKNTHETEPPPRFSEASIIKTLEGLGIGRPSTYAPTIALLKAREYIRVEKKAIFATEISFVVVDMLKEHFLEIVDSGFTARLEEKLDLIAESKLGWQGVLWEFYENFERQINSGKSNIASLKQNTPTGKECPECGKELVKRKSKFGEFVGCSGYPKCKYILRDSAESADSAGEVAESSDFGVCEKCGKAMVKKMGRNGAFIACSGYPKCKNAKSLNAKKERKALEGVKCPKCGGEIMERISRRGKFYGCGNYPKCDFISNGEPTDKKCDACDNKGDFKGMMIKKELKTKSYFQCLDCKNKVDL